MQQSVHHVGGEKSKALLWLPACGAQTNDLD